MDLLRIAHINSDKMLKTLGEAGIRVTKNFEAQLWCCENRLKGNDFSIVWQI